MERGLNVAVAGIPKTIDNDIDYIDMSFWFNSAVEAAQGAIRAAKTEAVCNLPNGIGIVKLMGRSAGYIAAFATMASSDVDLCLFSEVPVVLFWKDPKVVCLIYENVSNNKDLPSLSWPRARVKKSWAYRRKKMHRETRNFHRLGPFCKRP
jgi:6-phosphofructokinase